MQVLTYSIENNAHVVYAIANDGQNASYEHEVDFPAQNDSEDRKNTGHYQHIMQQSGYGAHTVMERTGHLTECPSHVEQNTNGRRPHSDNGNADGPSGDNWGNSLKASYGNGAKAGKWCRLAQLVERLAETYLKMGNVRCPPVPTGIVSLADEQRSIEIHALPLKAYHGAIWRLKEGWVVQLRDGDTSAGKRFALFHETFHILAHCRGTPVFKKRGLEQGSFNELLADYFAMCILAPRGWVVEKWAGVKDLDRMAEIFAVPKSAMCMRLKQLGLI